MHILITGGAGFIGSNLTHHFLKKGFKVHVVDNLSTGSEKNILAFQNNPNFFFDKADILTWDNLEKTVNWADKIFHLAAVVGVFKVLKEPISVLAINIAGCERLLRAAHKNHWNPPIIIASSSEVYGNRSASQSREPLREDMVLQILPGHNSRWNYSISKMADEAFAHSYAREYGMNVTVVRFFNVIGPGQTGRYGMVVPRFVDQAVQEKPITVYGTGEQTRSFMDVRDTVRALDLLSSTPLSVKQTVNVGSCREIAINDLAQLVKNISGSSSVIEHLDYEKVYGKNFEEIYNRRPSLDKLNRLIDFKHEWNLEQTIQHLADQQRKHYNKS